jgi:hypothetical protein
MARFLHFASAATQLAGNPAPTDVNRVTGRLQ